ncbi:MAG: plasmid pRiA4b ORF-3 family protein [Promethearchaeota archaeon]
MGKQNPKHNKMHIQRKNSKFPMEFIDSTPISEKEPFLDEEFPSVDQIWKDFRDFQPINFNDNNQFFNITYDDLPKFDSHSKNRIFQIKISIKYIRPPIWRRILIKDTSTFRDLHNAIQQFFDWDNYHLHEFNAPLKSSSKSVIRINSDKVNDFNVMNEDKVEIRQILSMENKRIHYLYDFGDNWEHLIVLEKIYTPSEIISSDYPICIKGKRATPPEDCGGVYGYEDISQALKSLNDTDNAELLEWVGDFDPEEILCEIIPLKEILIKDKK